MIDLRILVQQECNNCSKPLTEVVWVVRKISEDTLNLNEEAIHEALHDAVPGLVANLKWSRMDWDSKCPSCNGQTKKPRLGVVK